METLFYLGLFCCLILVALAKSAGKRVPRVYDEVELSAVFCVSGKGVRISGNWASLSGHTFPGASGRYVAAVSQRSEQGTKVCPLSCLAITGGFSAAEEEAGTSVTIVTDSGLLVVLDSALVEETSQSRLLETIRRIVTGRCYSPVWREFTMEARLLALSLNLGSAQENTSSSLGELTSPSSSCATSCPYLIPPSFIQNPRFQGTES